MKKLLLPVLLLTNLVVKAQQDLPDPGNKILPDKYFEIAIVLIAAWVAAAVLISLIKIILDNRLKVKMIEKGFPDEIIKNVLSADKSENKKRAFKWFLIFSGIAAGLFISLLFPAGIISIGIILLTTALSNLIYYFYLRKNEST